MKVELILNNDKELKSYIKELIKNEIINVTREEVKEITKNELNKKINNTDFYNETKIDNLIKQEVKIHLNKLLQKQNSSYFSTDFITNLIKQEVQTQINKTIITELINKIKQAL